MGSPPQVRGKLYLYFYLCHFTRITPAGAGKTFRAVVTSVAGWDHPRRCGENPCLTFVMLVDAGSPPQVRGKLKYILKIG